MPIQLSYVHSINILASNCKAMLPCNLYDKLVGTEDLARCLVQPPPSRGLWVVGKRLKSK